jgi:hypothetical protein
MATTKVGCLLILAAVALGCSDHGSGGVTSARRPPSNDPVPTSGWNIPVLEIVSTGTKDAIPSLSNPITIPAAEATYLGDQDLVIGIVFNGQARAYPHTILDWHEVVNEEARGNAISISYCPLTGTAIVFNTKHPGRRVVFGVSGLLFNSNLIMFDRETNSHWPQMRLQCDEGQLRNTEQIALPAIETTWGNWKTLYPNTLILSENTGFDRPYDEPGTAYPDYNLLESRALFPLTFRDTRLPPKQRVHGLLTGQGPDSYQSKAYLINPDQESRVINDRVGNERVLIVDSGINNFVTSYSRSMNGQTLTFEISGQAESFPFTFRDNETGSTWNVLGEAIEGDLAGNRLQSTLSFNAYWFAWGVFYRDTEIYED